MQLFTAGILGLVGLVLIVTGVNGSWWTLYGALTTSPSEPGTRRSGGGSFDVNDLVGAAVGTSPAMTTIKNQTGLGTAGGRMGSAG